MVRSIQGFVVKDTISPEFGRVVVPIAKVRCIGGSLYLGFTVFRNGCLSVLLFPKVNIYFLGCYEPENVFLDNANTQFSE